MHFLLGSSATIVWVQRVKARPCGKRATVHEHSLKMEEGEGGSWFLLQGKDADLLGASKKAPAHTSSVNVSAEDHMIAQCFWEATIPPLFSSFFFFLNRCEQLVDFFSKNKQYQPVKHMTVVAQEKATQPGTRRAKNHKRKTQYTSSNNNY